jgi:hypothetical protein
MDKCVSPAPLRQIMRPRKLISGLSANVCEARAGVEAHPCPDGLEGQVLKLHWREYDFRAPKSLAPFGV